MPRVLLSALAFVLSAGCAFGLPPTRTELGPSWSRDGHATRFAVGTHIGSLAPIHDTPIEFGGGLVYESDPRGGDMTPASHGAFADAGAVVLRREHARLIVGARLDHFWQGGITTAVKLRVDLEAIARRDRSTASGDDSCDKMWAASYGNVGIGAFVEAGPARLVDDTQGWVATAGVSVRLPAWGVVAVGCMSGLGRHGRHHPFGSSGAGSGPSS